MNITIQDLKPFCAKEDDSSLTPEKRMRFSQPWHLAPFGAVATDQKMIVCAPACVVQCVSIGSHLGGVGVQLLEILNGHAEYAEEMPGFGCGTYENTPSGEGLRKINGARYKQKYIDAILGLPNVRFIVKQEPQKDSDPLAFRFDGGCGMVMPVRI